MSLDSNLKKLIENQQSYHPNEAIQQLLAQKDFIMVVAPSSMGKSTLMNKVVELNSNFARVLNSTTRPQRANDEPGLYHYVPHNEEGIQQIADAVDKKQLIQYAVFPTTGYIYFTRPESYPASYNLLDTQSQVVEHLRALPFRHTHTVGVVTDPPSWQKWLSERYKKDDPEFPKRIEEAIRSLKWLLDQPEGTICWIYNHPDDTAKSATELIEVIRNSHTPHTSYRKYAEQLLELAYRLKG